MEKYESTGASLTKILSWRLTGIIETGSVTRKSAIDTTTVSAKTIRGVDEVAVTIL